MSFFSRLRSAGALPVEGHLPGFDRATGWLNSPPLSAADLQGKVVLVDFWTYTCINWLRTLAYLRAWAERYQDQGLVVIGVHTPEFSFERDVDNVRQAVKEMAVGYPVALDSDYAIWEAFANRFWPAAYIADGEGRIRHHQFGEGGYAECEMVIQRLLGESGRDTAPHDLVSVAPDGLEAQADWASLKSPETYLGYEQARGFASHDGAVLDQTHAYVAPDRLNLNHWALAGIGRRASDERTRPRRRPNPLPLPRPRHPPRHGPASTGDFCAVPRTHRWWPSRRCSRPRYRPTGPRNRRPTTALSADPSAGNDHRPHVRDHLPRSRRGGVRVHLRLGLPVNKHLQPSAPHNG